MKAKISLKFSRVGCVSGMEKIKEEEHFTNG
jgi:hypothetical protein